METQQESSDSELREPPPGRPASAAQLTFPAAHATMAWLFWKILFNIQPAVGVYASERPRGAEHEPIQPVG
jgi:hypothetical protein